MFIHFIFELLCEKASVSSQGFSHRVEIFQILAQKSNCRTHTKKTLNISC